jgi:hypothetical protein
MDAPADLEVDHINHNSLDNRRCNLRLASTSANQQNRRGPTDKSKTGIRGVWWHKKIRKWVATVKLNGKQHRVGQYDNLVDAERAVTEARAVHMPYSPEAYNLKEADSK